MILPTYFYHNISLVLGIGISYIILSLRLWITRLIFGDKGTVTQLLSFVLGGGVALLISLIPTFFPSFTTQIGSFDLGVLSPLVVSYFILAVLEEGSKLVASSGLFRGLGIVRSDLIIFGVLVALGFAFTENVLYLIAQGSDILQTVSLSVSRGLTGFLFHSIFTGAICVMIARAGPSWISKTAHLIGGCVLGVGLHLIYNLILASGMMGRFLIYLCSGYIFLTYLMYKSDRVYLNA